MRSVLIFPLGNHRRLSFAFIDHSTKVQTNSTRASWLQFSYPGFITRFNALYFEKSQFWHIDVLQWEFTSGEDSANIITEMITMSFLVTEQVWATWSGGAHNASHRTFPVRVPQGVLGSDCNIKPVLNETERKGTLYGAELFRRDKTCRCNPPHEIRRVIDFFRLTN